jgi:UDP-N-acetylmuramoyl-tripeptide--D-alanyl-D-alanine ligase
MLELGDRAGEFHRALGEMAAASDAAHIYVTGVFSAEVKTGAEQKRREGQCIFSGSREEILTDLKNRLSPGDWVLVKGSRGAGMEKIVSEIVVWAGGRITDTE